MLLQFIMLGSTLSNFKPPTLDGIEAVVVQWLRHFATDQKAMS